MVSFTPRPLYTRERAPGIYWIGGWVGPGAVPDAMVNRKIPSLRQESNSRTPIVFKVKVRNDELKTNMFTKTAWSFTV
jgi:hypothetical protein